MVAKIKACVKQTSTPDQQISPNRKYVRIKPQSLLQTRASCGHVPSITPLISVQLSAPCSPTAFVYQPDPLILPLGPFCDRKMLLA